MPFKGWVKWEDEKDNVLAMIDAGETMEAIGRRYGVSKQRVKQRLQQWGVYESGQAVNRARRIAAYRLRNGDRKNIEKDKYTRLRAKFTRKKANAVKVGVPWTIQFGELEWPEVCPVLGIPINYFNIEGHREDSPSFDRFDCSKGYIPGNVCVMSWRANRIKNDSTVDEHEKIAAWMRKQLNVSPE